MKLKIQNLGKIANAEIAFDGITVIAGDNNTGKSTVGKALFAFFNSLNHIGSMITRERDSSERFALTRILDEYLQDKNLQDISRFGYYRFIDNMEHISSVSRENLLEAIQNFLASEFHYTINKNDKQLNILFERLDTIRAVTNEEIEKLLIQREWSKVFNEQINSIQNDSSMRLDLGIRNKNFRMEFSEERCLAINIPFEIRNQAIFIHSPYVLDQVNNSSVAQIPFRRRAESMDMKLLFLLRQAKKYNAVDDFLRKEKINRITSTLKTILPGTFMKNDNGDYVYMRKEYKEGLHVNSLSTGLKSFAILNLLVNNAALDEKDVLIFDEPEVNLHPAWQLKYAELIVLLQKAFDLTVLFNTHSPYFLHAIEVYSAKHGVADRCKYYLAENQGDIASFQDVTGQTEEIYQKMLKPFEDLQGVAYDEP